MPDLEDDPLGAAGWMVTQILKDLQNAKVLPIKIVNMKHQEGLRSSAFMIYLIDIFPNSKMDFQIQSIHVNFQFKDGFSGILYVQNHSMLHWCGQLAG